MAGIGALGFVLYSGLAMFYVRSRYVVRSMTLKAHSNDFFDHINTPDYVYSLLHNSNTEMKRKLEEAVGEVLDDSEIEDMVVTLSRGGKTNVDRVDPSEVTQKYPSPKSLR